MLNTCIWKLETKNILCSEKLQFGSIYNITEQKIETYLGTGAIVYLKL